MKYHILTHLDDIIVIMRDVLNFMYFLLFVYALIGTVVINYRNSDKKQIVNILDKNSANTSIYVLLYSIHMKRDK